MLRGSVICRKCGRSSQKCQCTGPRTFAVKVYHGKDPKTGEYREKWQGGFRSAEAADQHRAKVAQDPSYGAGVGLHGSIRLRLGDYMAEWIEESDCGDREKASRRSRFRRHISPHLGHLPMARIAPPTLQQFFKRELRNLSTTTARKVYDDLRAVFATARSLGLVGNNPVECIVRPKRERFRSPIALWSRDHLRAFFSACENFGDKGLLFITTYFTAGRQGEMLGLDWDHLDLHPQEPTVTFIQDLERPPGGGADFDHTKTETSDGTVLIPVWLAARLRELLKRQKEERLSRGLCDEGRECKYQHCKRWHAWNLIFCQPNGKPLHGNCVTKRDLKRLCARADVPPIRFHDLRHLHNTILRRKNVNAGIIKDRARNSSAAFVIDRYTWAALDVREQEVAVAALEQDLPRSGHG